MFNVLRERYYWPGLHADVVSHVRECHECTLAKRLTRSLASPERSKLGSYPFDNLTVDIVTMGITHDGQYDKLLVFADSLSRWVEAVPFLGDPTSEQVMDAFLCHIACRYGWPRTIRSDGGSNLAGTLNKTLFSLTGVDFAQGAAYHSQSQGIAERVQGTLVQMARAANEGGEYWHDHLPFLLFSYHATPHRITGMSPAMLMYGRSLRLPAQRDDISGGSVGLLDDAPLAVREYAKRQTTLLKAAWAAAGELTRAAQEHHVADAYTTSTTSISFGVGDTVCYRLFDKQRKLVSSWFGPCRVLEVQQRGNYVLGDLPNQMKSSKFHVSQLRAYHATLPSDVLAADEYIVDVIRDRRVRNGYTQYLVKWRGHSLAKSTWEPRSELMRRCEEEIKAYDASAPLPSPVPAPAAPARVRQRRRQATPAPTSSPPPAPAAPDYVGEALPHAANLRKGKWSYARRDATLRGLKVKWIGSEAFSWEVLATPHFVKLRRNALDTAPSHIAAAMRSIAEHIASDTDLVGSGPVPTTLEGQERDNAREIDTDREPVTTRGGGQATNTIGTNDQPLLVSDTAAILVEERTLPNPVAATRGRAELPRLVPPYMPTDRRFSSPPFGVRPSGTTQTAIPKANSSGVTRWAQNGQPTTGRPGTVRPPHDVSPPDMSRMSARLEKVTTHTELPQPVALATRMPTTRRPPKLPPPIAREIRPSGI
jgi:hypothetical protein